MPLVIDNCKIRITVESAKRNPKMSQSRKHQLVEAEKYSRALKKKHSTHRRDSKAMHVEHYQEPQAKVIQKSPFLQLPGDIRNIVYDFVFRQPDGMHVDMDADQKPYKQDRGIFALSMTCRAIYNETRDLPFWLNTVHLRVPVLQDLTVVRSSRYRDSVPASTHRKKPAGWPHNNSLASVDMAIRQKAQDCVTLAMRLPHLDQFTTRLRSVLSSPATLQRLRRVHVHLGFQTNNVFIERFYTAWMEILPYLRLLRQHSELRVSFQLRLSRRLVVDYDFEVDDPLAMLREMDSCVLADGELTLPELAIVNAVRFRVWSGLFGASDSSMGICPRPFFIPGRRGPSRSEATMAAAGGGVLLAV